MIVSMVAPCARWVCGPSPYYAERLEERGGLAASIIGVEDRVYADLYKRAVADEYVNEACGVLRLRVRIRTWKWRHCTVGKSILQRNCTVIMEMPR